MDILEIRENRVYPTVFALITDPFKTIWNNDTSKDKTEALKLFSYVTLLCSPKKANSFYGYNETERLPKVLKQVYGDENAPITTEMILLVAEYKEMLMTSIPGYDLFLASLSAADKLRIYLNSVNLNERTNGGAAVIKPKDITAALRDIPDTIKGLNTMRDKMDGELIEESKTRNQREIGGYER